VRVSTAISCQEPVREPEGPAWLGPVFGIALVSFIALVVLIGSNLFRTRGRRHGRLATTA
jgi:hypothetical protein